MLPWQLLQKSTIAESLGSWHFSTIKKRTYFVKGIVKFSDVG